MASSSDELSEQLVDRCKTLDIAIFLTEQAFDASTGNSRAIPSRDTPGGPVVGVSRDD